MKKIFSFIILISIFILSCDAACIGQLCESKEEKATRRLEKLEKQKKEIEELNAVQDITLSLSTYKSSPNKIARYIYPADVDKVTWKVEISDANPNNCLEIKIENGLFQNPNWNPDENPCYYQWELCPKSKGQAHLKLSQILNDKIMYNQWVKITITD